MEINSAAIKDIKNMVALSDLKRSEYEKYQPQFWKKAENANEIQAKWFKELLIREDHIILIAQENEELIGFVVGRLIKAPEVYNPGGMTLMIDDFCVKSSDLWIEVGGKLIEKLKELAIGAAQILVVCGHHDELKKEFLKKIGLSIASEWYVGSISK